MQTRDDIELLREYTEHHCEEAFAALVARRMGMVYGVALRCLGNPHYAEEVTQAVFIILAKKANTVRNGAISSWLFQTTRLTAANFARTEWRRQRREQEAYMQSLSEQQRSEGESSPLLDDALSRLGERDRQAVFLRFVEEKDCKQIAQVLGTSEDAARVRVRRALDKLRKLMLKRGVAVSASAVASAIVATSAQAAPASLSPVLVTSVAIKGAAVSSSTAALAKSTLAVLTWAKFKTAMVVSVALLVVGGSVALVAAYRLQNSALVDDAVWESVDRSIEALRTLPPMAVVRKTVISASGPAAVPSTPFVVAGRMQQGALQSVVCATMKDADRAIGGMARGFPQGLSRGSTGVGRDLSARALLATAYGCAAMELHTSLPGGHYNYLVTMPGDPRSALQAALQKTLQLDCRLEMRQTNVLVLRSRQAKASGFVACSHPHCQALATEMANLCWALESFAGRPVIDETGLQGGMHVDPQIDYSPSRLARDGEEAMRSIAAQLGLELSATERLVPVLVVRRAHL